MSAVDKGETKGGQNGPSVSVDPTIEAVAQIASHLARVAVGPDGKLQPGAEFQMAIRGKEERSETLERLVLEVCPNGVDGARWKAWLDGGRSPFEDKPKKVAPGAERPSQTLVRSSNKVRGQEKKVERARQDLEDAERELAFVKAYENAAVHWYVVSQLIDIMEPAIAVGPAWTIMRALSSYASDDAADKATNMFVGGEKEDAIVYFRKIRARDTREIFEALDLFAGVPDFEEAVRAAILKVCKDFEPRREKVVSTGRRPRSEKAMKTTAHPEAQGDADDVLEGLQVT